jgi:hypothetical protein
MTSTLRPTNSGAISINAEWQNADFSLPFANSGAARGRERGLLLCWSLLPPVVTVIGGQHSVSIWSAKVSIGQQFEDDHDG